MPPIRQHAGFDTRVPHRFLSQRRFKSIIAWRAAVAAARSDSTHDTVATPNTPVAKNARRTEAESTDGEGDATTQPAATASATARPKANGRNNKNKTTRA